MQEEILAAIRENGIANLNDVEAVVLETDASFSVIPRHENPSKEVFENVGGWDMVQSQYSSAAVGR